MFRATRTLCLPFVRPQHGVRWPAVAIAAAILASATVSDAGNESPDTHGTWTAERDDGRLYLQLNYRPRFNYGFTLSPNELVGNGDRWRLERDAGMFELRGVFDGRRGGGTFVFRPNEAFRAALVERKLGTVDDKALAHLAAIDMSLEFIDGLRALGYAERLNRLTEMRIHGATPAYVKELKSLGYENIGAKRLVEMRIHKVTPEYIRAFQSLGYASLSARRLVEMRIHNVNPDDVRTFSELGYEDLSARRLVEMRIHGVTPDYVQGMRKLGMAPRTKDLLQMRIHGIDAGFLEAMRARGYKDLSPRQAIELRIHGVAPSFVDDLEELGYEDVSTRELIDPAHSRRRSRLDSPRDRAARRTTVRSPPHRAEDPRPQLAAA